ncbi:MAG: c-type cytochrome [Variovorax sp.]
MKPLLTLAFACVMAFAAATASSQTVVGNVKNGEAKIALCIGCHGITGYQASFPEIYKVPRIAGQSATYIEAALQEYQEGARKHPTMGAVASNLTKQDMADLAAYYSQLGVVAGDAPPAVPARQPSERVSTLIKRNAADCTTCHGANFNTPIPGAPKLAGQYPDYLYAALKAYKTVNNPHVGRNNAVMGAQVQPYTHPELKELASYIASLPGEVKTVGESRFHRSPD